MSQDNPLAKLIESLKATADDATEHDREVILVEVERLETEDFQHELTGEYFPIVPQQYWLYKTSWTKHRTAVFPPTPTTNAGAHFSHCHLADHRVVEDTRIGIFRTFFDLTNVEIVHDSRWGYTYVPPQEDKFLFAVPSFSPAEDPVETPAGIFNNVVIGTASYFVAEPFGGNTIKTASIAYATGVGIVQRRYWQYQKHLAGLGQGYYTETYESEDVLVAHAEILR